VTSSVSASAPSICVRTRLRESSDLVTTLWLAGQGVYCGADDGDGSNPEVAGRSWAVRLYLNIGSSAALIGRQLRAKQGTWLWSRRILVYPPALHDNLKVLGGVGDQFDILQRVALDQQQIGKRALFHDAELPCIRTTLAGQCK
jgi:hypothetical protein